MGYESGNYISGERLNHEIDRAGFSINKKKTRIQYRDSRQDVTGLVVNKKPNTKKEYWRLARAKCNAVFNTGEFTTIKDGDKVQGNLNELEGQLSFIDQVDHYNRLRQKKPLQPEYATKNKSQDTKTLLTGREKTFSQFLFYRLFCGNEKPTILCEGKTDNIYLKSAISELQADFKQLASIKDGNYKLGIRFVEYSKRSRFLLQLYGGTSYLQGFIQAYEKNMRRYNGITPKNPVIIVLDNDNDTKVYNILENKKKYRNKITLEPSHLKKPDGIRKSEFIHIIHNLYVVYIPLGRSGEKTDIEYFFDDKTRLLKHSNGKCFNTVKNRDTENDLSKQAFASHIIKERKKSIDFSAFKPILN